MKIVVTEPEGNNPIPKSILEETIDKLIPFCTDDRTEKTFTVTLSLTDRCYLHFSSIEDFENFRKNINEIKIKA